ncbi:MAG: ABC transporter substrate-binding protein, partial [Bdellovibrionales bacterium]|nr:ABC transporter substrate-binding protein [Bdellovibrionales bacterium]
LFFLWAPLHAAALNLSCSRIVSLAPSVTELVYLLNLQSHLMGVTRYCEYPPAASQKPRVGGFLDPNYEAIIALKPTLVVLLKEQEDIARQLNQYGFKTLLVEHRNISGILESISKLGSQCRQEKRAKAAARQIDGAVRAIADKLQHATPVRTLISVGRSGDPNTIRQVYLSGNDGFYTELLKLAGGENVYTGETVSLPTVSTEGIISLKPDLIVEIVPHLDRQGWTKSQIKRSWESAFSAYGLELPKVLVVSEKVAAIPGPRFPEVLDLFAKALHPEAF